MTLPLLISETYFGVPATNSYDSTHLEAVSDSYGFDADAAGNLYVLENNRNTNYGHITGGVFDYIPSRVRVLPAGGGEQTVWTAPPTNTGLGAFGLCVGADPRSVWLRAVSGSASRLFYLPPWSLGGGTVTAVEQVANTFTGDESGIAASPAAVYWSSIAAPPAYVDRAAYTDPTTAHNASYTSNWVGPLGSYFIHDMRWRAPFAWAIAGNGGINGLFIAYLDESGTWVPLIAATISGYTSAGTVSGGIWPAADGSLLLVIGGTPTGGTFRWVLYRIENTDSPVLTPVGILPNGCSARPVGDRAGNLYFQGIDGGPLSNTIQRITGMFSAAPTAPPPSTSVPPPVTPPLIKLPGTGPGMGPLSQSSLACGAASVADTRTLLELAQDYTRCSLHAFRVVADTPSPRGYVLRLVNVNAPLPSGYSQADSTGMYHRSDHGYSAGDKVMRLGSGRLDVSASADVVGDDVRLLGSGWSPPDPLPLYALYPQRTKSVTYTFTPQHFSAAIEFSSGAVHSYERRV